MNMADVESSPGPAAPAVNGIKQTNLDVRALSHLFLLLSHGVTLLASMSFSFLSRMTFTMRWKGKELLQLRRMGMKGVVHRAT